MSSSQEELTFFWLAGVEMVKVLLGEPSHRYGVSLEKLKGERS